MNDGGITIRIMDNAYLYFFGIFTLKGSAGELGNVDGVAFPKVQAVNGICSLCRKFKVVNLSVNGSQVRFCVVH